MKPFTTLTTTAVPLGLANCDTDQLVPARFLSRKRDEGFGVVLFHDLRVQAAEAGSTFMADRPEHTGAQILLAGRNFGCGSSRESAVWALVDAGYRAVIAPSFGDIFFGNAFKNGLLPIVLAQDVTESWTAIVREQPGVSLDIDLTAQQVSLCGGQPHRFDIDPLRKHLLLKGLDELALTQSYAAQIEAFSRQYAARQPWLAA